MAGQISNPLNSIIKNFDLLSVNPFIDELRSLWKKNRPDQDCLLDVDVHVRLIIRDKAENKQYSKAMKIATRFLAEDG